MKKAAIILLCLLILAGCKKQPQRDNSFFYQYRGDFLLEEKVLNLFVGDILEIEITGGHPSEHKVLSLDDESLAEIILSNENPSIYRIIPLKSGETKMRVSDSYTTEVRDLTVDEMEIYSIGIDEGVIADSYGKFGSQKKNGIPTYSLPIDIGNAPLSAKCFALSMIDTDAKDFVHWLAVNFAAYDLGEDASLQNAESLLQGKNSFGKKGYGGPTPSDKTHTYVITVYALSEPLELKEGFSYQQFQKALEGKIIKSAEIKGQYRSK